MAPRDITTSKLPDLNGRDSRLPFTGRSASGRTWPSRRIVALMSTPIRRAAGKSRRHATAYRPVPHPASRTSPPSDTPGTCPSSKARHCVSTRSPSAGSSAFNRENSGA
jgi:hypothetical protein